MGQQPRHLLRSAGGDPTPGPERYKTPSDPNQITLVVTPQDAVTLNYIMLNLKGASLNLVLRSAGDTKSMSAEAVTLQFLMDQYNIPFPSKLPYGSKSRKGCLVHLHHNQLHQ